MPSDPLFCHSCGKAHVSPTSLCLHCGHPLLDEHRLERTFVTMHQKRSITRRTVLAGITGAAGVLAVGSGAGLWYLSTRNRRPQLLIYTGHGTAPITTLAWSPDGNTLASGDANGTVLIWDPASGATLLSCREAAATGPTSVSWSPDGRSILAGYSNRLVIWDAQSGKSTLTTAQLHGPAAYSPAGQYKPCYLIYSSLLAACQNQSSVCVFPSTSLAAPITSFAAEQLGALAFEPEALQPDIALLLPPPSQTLVIYGAQISSTCAHNGPPNAVLSYEQVDAATVARADAGELSYPWGAGGGYLLAGSSPANVAISGTWGSYEMNHPASVVAAALCPARKNLPPGANPDGWYTVIGYIATADAEGTVRVWGNDGQSIIALRAQHPVLQLAWSPDGNFLAVVQSNGTVQIWQAQLSNLPALWRNTSFN